MDQATHNKIVSFIWLEAIVAPSLRPKDIEPERSICGHQPNGSASRPSGLNVASRCFDGDICEGQG